MPIPQPFIGELALHCGGYNPRILRAEDCKLWADLSQFGSISCVPHHLVSIRQHSYRISFNLGPHRQAIDQIASLVCFNIAQIGRPDPSTTFNQNDWKLFLDWIQQHPFVRFRLFCERSLLSFKKFLQFFSLSAPADIFFILFFICSFPFIVYDRLFGSFIPQTLANEWCRRYTSVSYSSNLDYFDND